MTETFKFFDGQELYQADWSKAIGKVLLDGVICGVDNDLFVFADGSGMVVKVSTGAMHIKGHYYFTDAQLSLAISAAPGTAGQSRYDLVVGEVNWTAKTMSIKVVEGTPSATPSLPSLTRSTTIWQDPLSIVTVANGDVVVAANKVQDVRGWALGTFSLPLIIGTGIATITTGAMPAGIVIPLRSKIVAYHMTADAAGSIVVDLWADTMTNYPPTVADTICNASHKPTLSSARTASKKVWSEGTNINQNGAYWPNNTFTPSETDVLGGKPTLLANIDSAATVKQVALSLVFARMASA